MPTAQQTLSLCLLHFLPPSIFSSHRPRIRNIVIFQHPVHHSINKLRKYLHSASLEIVVCLQFASKTTKDSMNWSCPDPLSTTTTLSRVNKNICQQLSFPVPSISVSGTSRVDATFHGIWRKVVVYWQIRTSSILPVQTWEKWKICDDVIVAGKNELPSRTPGHLTDTERMCHFWRK